LLILPGVVVPLALKTSSFALAESIPTEFGKLINMQTLALDDNSLTGTPVCSFRLVGSTSLPLALKTSSSTLAGSIPTEFGELIKLTYLGLDSNKLTGTPRLLILPGVVVRVYHLL
jgi:Leucine-rich repeat (LRR) protein